MEHFIIFFIIFGLFIFLFSLFALSRGDFLLLRKNISLDELFSLTFIGTLLTVFFSRIFYVLEHLNKIYLHPLVFLIFPYFPGLSLSGALVSGYLFIYYISKKRKYPFRKILDIFSLSFSISVCLEFLFYFLFNLIFLHFTFFIFSFVVLLITNIFLIWMFINSRVEDGIVGYLSMIFINISFILGLLNRSILISVKSNLIELILLFLMLVLSLIFFIKLQFFSKKKR